MSESLSPQQLELLRIAKEHLDNEKYSEASAALETLNDSVQGAEINHLLVEALYLDKQYKLAQQYLEERVEDYFQDDKLFVLMINVYLRNHQLITAWELALNTSDKDLQSSSLKLVTDQEKEDEEQFAMTIQTISRNFIHLGDQRYAEQNKRVKNALVLPRNTYIQDAKFLLRDPYVNPIVQTSIVSELHKLHVDESTKLYSYDQKEYAIVPSELTLPGESGIVKSILIKMVGRFGQDDPSLLENLKATFSIQTLIAYPFFNQIVEDEDIWIQVLVNDLTGQESDLTDNKTKKIKETQDKLFRVLNEVEL